MKHFENQFVGDRLLRDMRAFVKTAAPHQRLASARSLASEYAISHVSVMNVMDALVADGLVYKQHGKGCFVAERPGGSLPGDSRRSILFGCNWKATSHAYYFQIWHGVAHAVDMAGYHLQVLPLGLGNGSDYAVLQTELDRRGAADPPAGLIMPWIGGPTLHLLEQTCPGLPIVISQSLEQEQQLCSVIRDFYALGYQSAQYLLERGARRIATVYRSADYLQGLHDGLAAASPAPALTVLHFERPPDTVALAQQILAARPDGVAISEDRVALALLHEIGRYDGTFLDETAIIAHANTGDDILPRQVARLENDGFQRGVVTANTLLQMIDGTLTAPVAIRIKPRLVRPGEAASMAPVADSSLVNF